MTSPFDNKGGSREDRDYGRGARDEFNLNVNGRGEDPEDDFSEYEYDEGEYADGELDLDYSDESPEDPKPGITPWGLFVKLFVSPLKMWKLLKKSNLRPEQVASACFYPLVALASLSVFAAKIYDPEYTLTELLIKAVGVFVSFFIGYFLTQSLSRLVLRGDAGEKLDENYGRCWMMYVMSTLSLFYFIYEVFPPIEPIVVFTPLFSIYAALRGVRFLRLKRSSEMKVGWTVAILSIAVPSALYYLFEALVPAA